MPAGSSGGDGEVEAGFAKLQGEDFEYYMQTYSIMLGRNSKKSTVDVDLSSLGGGMNISRHHSRIFYDFQRRRFALDVIGKNGCLVEGVLHLPGNPPVKLDSQDLLQIGDKKFYFLLPTRSIFASAAAARHAPVIPSEIPPASYVRPGHPRLSDFHDRSSEGDYGQEGDDIGNGVSESGKRGKLIKRTKKPSGELDIYGGHPIGVEAIGTLGEGDNRSEIRLRSDRDMDNQHILQAEEKDIVSSVATVLSDLCGPGEWMPMAKLHTELLDQFGNVWHHSRVRKYLTRRTGCRLKRRGGHGTACWCCSGSTQNILSSTRDRRAGRRQSLFRWSPCSPRGNRRPGLSLSFCSCRSGLAEETDPRVPVSACPFSEGGVVPCCALLPLSSPSVLPLAS